MPSLIGNKPNQVPSNGDLGTLAFQDASNVIVGNVNATGVTTVQSGTVSAPAITTTGDTNTGIFFPAADTIAFTEGGVESMRINSSANVGIGTDSPANRLSVLNASATQALFYGYSKIANAANNGSGSVFLGNNPTNQFIIDYDTASATIATIRNSFAFDTAVLQLQAGTVTFASGSSFTERMRITSAGNVGIGSTSPSTNLQVGTTGNGVRKLARVTGNYNFDGAYLGGADTNGGGSLELLGHTSAPNSGGWQLLHHNDIASGALLFRNASGVSAYSSLSYTERMRIDASGNLGLGVTPSAWNSSIKAMQISSVACITGDSSTSRFRNNTFTNSSAAEIYITSAHATDYAQNAGRHLWFNAPSGTSGNAITFTQAMTLDASGNLGIGVTAPATQLATLGNVNIGNNSSTNPVSYLRFGATQFGAADIRPTNESTHKVGLSFYTDGTADATINPTERMRIDSAGNVGIGTSSPVQKLDVTSSSADTRIYIHNSSTGATAADGLMLGCISSDAYVFQYENSPLIFGTNAAERMRLSASGVLELSVGQIKFPATQQASADANTLDDYEEGTWTPAITFGGGNTGIGYNSQVGRYTKIGNVVYYSCVITLSSKGSSTGDVAITGLPFTVSNAGTYDFINGSPRAVVTLTFTAPLYSGATRNSTALFLLDNNAGTQRTLTNTAFANNTELSFSGFYYV